MAADGWALLRCHRGYSLRAEARERNHGMRDDDSWRQLKAVRGDAGQVSHGHVGHAGQGEGLRGGEPRHPRPDDDDVVLLTTV